MRPGAGGELGNSPEAIAAAFVAARRAGAALHDFPGPIPATLAEGYAIQERAIGRWPDAVAGWKVGAIAPAQRERDGDARLVGPVFRGNLQWANDGDVLDFPVFEGGFAAVEGEFVFRLARDADAAQKTFSPADAAQLVASMHVGIETAGSPLATINALGPTVIVSDFGNNAGLIVGPPISDWRTRAPQSLTCTTYVAGMSVGRGAADAIDGGPLSALAFALGHLARRGRRARAGDCITTGAITGVHDVVAGQPAHVVFDGIATLRCRAVRAKAQ
ncbi:MAG TPA: 2-keto-4-pentenoate hydratase [Xanthomonadales bacterium]|nr:2-keto-4-pentenoate hydratase [Xanthomonadales bacterium]